MPPTAGLGIGIDRLTRITSHVARHSFADYARRRIKDITIVRDLLGHSSVNVTEYYFRSLDNTVLKLNMSDIFK